jgi:hypothetical protein
MTPHKAQGNGERSPRENLLAARCQYTCSRERLIRRPLDPGISLQAPRRRFIELAFLYMTSWPGEARLGVAEIDLEPVREDLGSFVFT